MRAGTGLTLGLLATALAGGTAYWFLSGGRGPGGIGSGNSTPPPADATLPALAPAPTPANTSDPESPPPLGPAETLLAQVATAAEAAEYDPAYERPLVALATLAQADAHVLEHVAALVWADGTSSRLRLLLLPVLAVGRDHRPSGVALARAIAEGDPAHLLAALKVAGIKADWSVLVALEAAEDPDGPPFWRTWHQAFLGPRAYDGTEDDELDQPAAWQWLTNFHDESLRPGIDAMFAPVARATREAWQRIGPKAETFSAAVSALDYDDPADRALVEEAFIEHHRGDHTHAEWFLLDAGDVRIDDCLRRVILHPRVWKPGEIRPYRSYRPEHNAEADRIDRLVNRLLEERFQSEQSVHVRKAIVGQLAHIGGAGKAESMLRLAAVAREPEVLLRIVETVTWHAGHEQWTNDQAASVLRALLDHPNADVAEKARSSLDHVEEWARGEGR